MSTPTTPKYSCLRYTRFWVGLPFAAYLMALPFLGLGALFVPSVIMNAPLGIISYFEEISLKPTPEQVTAMAAIHVCFWLLFVAGVSLNKILPPVWLWLIWLILVTALLMSITGCAAHLGPEIKIISNWR